MSNCGAVISGAIANLAARALTKKYLNLKGKSTKNPKLDPKPVLTCYFLRRKHA